MWRRHAPLRLLTALIAAAMGVATTWSAVSNAAPAARQDSALPPAPQYYGTESGWSYRGSAADPSASTLLSSPISSGLVLLYCEGGQIGFHLSLGTTDRRSLTGAEDGLLQVYALDGLPTYLQEAEQEQDETDQGSPGQDASDRLAVDRVQSGIRDPNVSLLGQFRIRFFSDFEFRSLPLREPEWNSPDRLLKIMRDHPGGLRLVVTRLRQNRFTSTRTADLHLPGDTDGSGLAIDTALALLERDCRTGLKSEDSDAEGEPSR